MTFAFPWLSKLRFLLNARYHFEMVFFGGITINAHLKARHVELDALSIQNVPFSPFTARHFKFLPCFGIHGWNYKRMPISPNA